MTKNTTIEPMVMTCATGVREGWNRGELFKLVISGIARQFRHVDEPTREQLLVARPPLTGTPWDALLAAVVEHVATLHGHEPPAWVDEPERFRQRPTGTGVSWRTTSTMAINGLACAPAAFLRHGVVTDPRDLDERAGELECWSGNH